MPDTNYRINPKLPRYERVPVFSEGEWKPCNCGGRTNFDAAYVQDLADSYAPVKLYAATLNDDHWMWSGPAYGIVTALYAEKNEDGLLTLYADVANVPLELAEQIDNGQWPARSIEWHDAEIIANYCHGADWEAHVEEYLFYGQHVRYLTGLALLGQREPAVAGLGQWPEQAPPVIAEDGEELQVEVRIHTEPLAASRQAAHQRLRLFSHFDNSPKEGAPMAKAAEATKQTTGDPAQQATRSDNTPAPETGASHEQIRENERLLAEKAELERQEAESQQAFNARLAAENDTLKREVAELRAGRELDRTEQMRRDVIQAARERNVERDSVVAELRSAGNLVPANEPAFIAAYDALHGQQPTMLATAAGERVAAEQSPLELLLAFARASQMRSARELAAETAQRPGQISGSVKGQPSEQDYAEAKKLKVSMRAFMKSKYDVDFEETAGGDK